MKTGRQPDIDFEISKLEADILLTNAEIKRLQDINETRESLIAEWRRKQELLTALA